MEALPIIPGAEQQENREQPVGAESVIVVQGPPPTEEQVLSQVMTKARQNRSKSCHERSDSMKKYTKRKRRDNRRKVLIILVHMIIASIIPKWIYQLKQGRDWYIFCDSHRLVRCALRKPNLGCEACALTSLIDDEICPKFFSQSYTTI